MKSVTRFDSFNVGVQSNVPPCLSPPFAASPYRSIVAYKPNEGHVHVAPADCPSRTYVHSNFASSHSYLLSVLLPLYPPTTDFCLVKDSSVQLDDGYEEEVSGV